MPLFSLRFTLMAAAVYMLFLSIVLLFLLALDLSDRADVLIFVKWKNSSSASTTHAYDVDRRIGFDLFQGYGYSINFLKNGMMAMVGGKDVQKRHCYLLALNGSILFESDSERDVSGSQCTIHLAPDKQSVLFVSSVSGENLRQLDFVQQDGSVRSSTIEITGAYFVRWFPDSRGIVILYESVGDLWNLWKVVTVNADDMSVHQLLELQNFTMRSTYWHDEIVPFTSEIPLRITHIIDGDVNRTYLIYSNGTISTIPDSAGKFLTMVWSPEGAAAVTFDQVSNLNNHPRSRLQLYSSVAEISQPITPARTHWLVSWSPDGSHIALADENRHNMNSSSSGMAVYDVETGSYTPLVKSALRFVYHAWSPDGRYLVYANVQKNYSRFELYDTQTGEIRAIAPLSSFNGTMGWTSDSRYAFMIDLGNVLARIDTIYLYDPQTGELRRSANSMSGYSTWHLLADDSGLLIPAHSVPNAARMFSFDTMRFELIKNYVGMERTPLDSPDGRFRAYTSETTQGTDIFILNYEGHSAFRVTHNEGTEWLLGWLPP